jgi:uncharacterized protein
VISVIIGTAKIQLGATWVHSLKEKRMIVKSIMSKISNKFNVSVAEVEHQDIHQTIVLGIACVSNDTKHANSTLQSVIDFVETSTDAVVEDIQIEIL